MNKEKAKIFCITAKTEYELVRLLNKSAIPSFATQILQKLDGTFVAFLYYY